MNTTSNYFARTYAEAREGFLAAAKQRGLAVETTLNPLQGAQGEELATDAVLLGKADTQSLLIVTSGTGIVANETEQREIKVGDVAHIKAGERHWHGAKADTTMGHISITLVGSTAKWG